MSIKPIINSDWPEILQLQSQVYYSVQPESIEVLQDKWLRSPSNCFICRSEERLMGYLLAHSWNSKLPPKLFNRLPQDTEGEILFLHDLAVSSCAVGKGIGTRMLEQLENVAITQGYKEILLVSVQESRLFWEKRGFERVTQDVCVTYGEGANLMKKAL